MNSLMRNPKVVAVAIGGTSALFHLAQHIENAFIGSAKSQLAVASLAIGQGLLYAAPLFLGILAGLTFPARAVRSALQLVGICLLTAAPLMFHDLLCLIVIVPVCLVIAPLAATLAAATRGPGSPPGIGGTGALLLSLPFVLALADTFAPAQLPAEVALVDSVELSAPRDRVWRSLEHLHLRFDRKPPWLLAMLMPVPRAIVGGGVHVGARRRVVFSNGTAIATVTQAHAPERFVFQLAVESSGAGFFDHWVQLGVSEIALEALANGGTRVTHRTMYRPRALPRWYFAPIEQALGSMVQRHMLEAYGDALMHAEAIAER